MEKEMEELETLIKGLPDAVQPYFDSNRDQLESKHKKSKPENDTAVQGLKAIVPTSKSEVPRKTGTLLPQFKL